MNGPKLSTKSPIKLLAAWLALVFVCCTIMPLVYFVPKKTTIKNPEAAVEVEYTGKILAEEVFAKPNAELQAEASVLGEIVESLESISTAFADDFNSYLTKTTSTDDEGNETQTVTGVNSLGSSSDVSGSGTEADPYVVYTLRGWLWVANKIQYGIGRYIYINLGADIDFSDYLYDFVNIMGGAPFVGVLDGCGYSLKNLFYSTALFPGVGAFYSEESDIPFQFITDDGNGGTNTQNVIKNLNIEAVSCVEDMEFSSLFGIVTYNTLIQNCSFDLYAFEYGWITGLYTFGGTDIKDCYFNLRAYNGSCGVLGIVAAEMLAESGMDTSNLVMTCSVDNCKFDINTYENSDYYGVVAMMSYGGGLTISNCKTYGYRQTTRSSSEGWGVYTGHMDTATGANTILSNCENYVTIAGPCAIGAFVGVISYADSVPEDEENVYIYDCINYGDVYWTYDQKISNMNTTSYGALSGFVGVVARHEKVVIDGCINYGDMVGGTNMAGFVGKCEGKMDITNCTNYGGLNYHVNGNMSYGAAYAGIAVIGTNSSPVKSAYIYNCAFVGTIKNKDYYYDETAGSWVKESTDMYANSMFAGILAVACAKISTTPAQCIGNIIIQNCYVDMTLESGRINQVAAIFLNVGLRKFADNSTVLIDDNMAFISSRHASAGVALTWETWSFSMSSYMIPALFAYTNNYVEMNASNCAVAGTVGSSDGISNSDPVTFNLSNCQFVINAELDSSNLNEEVVDDLEFGVCLFGKMKEENCTFNISDITYSFNLKVAASCTKEVDVTFSEVNEDWNACNMVLDYTSNIEGDENIKQYYHSDDSVEKFSADKWFYSPELNGGRPMLRQFFHLAKYYTGQDCLARFTELGYTQYVEEETTA